MNLWFAISAHFSFLSICLFHIQTNTVASEWPCTLNCFSYMSRMHIQNPWCLEPLKEVSFSCQCTCFCHPCVKRCTVALSQKSQFGLQGAMPGLARSTVLQTPYSCRSLEAWKQGLHNRTITHVVPAFPIPEIPESWLVVVKDCWGQGQSSQSQT